MGKGGRIKKSRGLQVKARKKNLSGRKLAIVFLSALGIVAFGILMYKYNSSNILNWDRNKVLASPANSVEYTQAVLREIVKVLPADLLKSQRDNAYSGQKTMRIWIEDIIENEIPYQVSLITQAKELAHQGATIELEWRPDKHILPIDLPKDFLQEIKEKQQKHINYFQQKNPDIIFAEAVYAGRISRQRLIRDLKDAAERETGESVDDNQVNQRNDGLMQDFWWSSFIDKEKPKIFGIEDREIVSLGTYIIVTNIETVKSNHLTQLSDKFQYYWREQIVLANIIATLRKENAHKASLVFGEGHLETFPYLCELWGVKLKIVN